MKFGIDDVTLSADSKVSGWLERSGEVCLSQSNSTQISGSAEQISFLQLKTQKVIRYKH